MNNTVYGSFDVIVCGGGTSGVAAAISAARVGAKTILVERVGALGGQMTVSGPPGFAYANIFNDSGEQVINGFLGETHARLEAEGHAMPFPPPGERRRNTYAFVDPDWWGYLVFEMIKESGVRLLLHTLVVDVVKEGNKVCGVVVEHTGGRQTIMGKVVIDCTGEGDIALRAGAPFEMASKDDPYPIEPPSTAFAMDGIDWDTVLKYVQENIKASQGTEAGLYADSLSKLNSRILAMKSGRELIAVGHTHNFFDALTRKLIASGEYHPFGDIGFFFTPRDGGVIQAQFQHSAQVPNCDCTDIDELTAAEVEARRQAVITLNVVRKYLPGFQNAYLTRSCTELRIRETRRIMGDYKLEWNDANTGRKFPDVIGKSVMTMGARHLASADTLSTYSHGIANPPEGGSFDIPYRVLVPRDVEQMLVAGKMVSAERDCYLRFLPETIETGQAAGVAAALCVKRGISPRELEKDVSELQATLQAQGVILFGTH